MSNDTAPAPYETQAEARQAARSLNSGGTVPDGLVAVAMPYPLGCWGGTEKGWTVVYMQVPSPRSTT